VVPAVRGHVLQDARSRSVVRKGQLHPPVRREAGSSSINGLSLHRSLAWPYQSNCAEVAR
jgi:hypothetical protein